LVTLVTKREGTGNVQEKSNLFFNLIFAPKENVRMAGNHPDTLV